jgi:TatD DNase family protein
MLAWIDTHCHLDAPEFVADVAQVRASAAQAGVRHCVLPAVAVSNFAAVRTLAYAHGDSYALGIHPLYVAQAGEQDLDALDAALTAQRDDPRLVAVGEIGLDYLVPALCQSPLRERQMHFYRAQLRLARKHGLPVILHVRRSADQLFQGLREVGGVAGPWQGIAHAFNGSIEQAQRLVGAGLKLGFGGAFTYERALQLRRLATELPLEALVLETDAPDMPPHWLYATAAARAAGQAQDRNSPQQLPRIGAALAVLRGITPEAMAQASTTNAVSALPRLGPFLGGKLGAPYTALSSPDDPNPP